jgi:transposase
MTQPLSLDLRRRVIEVYEEGLLPQWLVAKQFRIGEATMRRLVALKRETGDVVPRPRTYGPASRVDAASEGRESMTTSRGTGAR